MNLLINNEQIEVIFDYGGNVYFKHNQNYFDLDVDSNNNLTCGACIVHDNNENLSNKQIKIGELKLTSDSKSLKGHAQREIDRKISLMDNSDDIAEFNEDEQYKYLYEDKEYNDYDSQNDDDDDDNNEYVKFLSLGETVNIYDYDDSVALYDTLIYNDDMEHGVLCFKTCLVGINPCFRLKIYKNGIISFRALGTKDNMYRLVFSDGEINLINY